MHPRGVQGKGRGPQPRTGGIPALEQAEKSKATAAVQCLRNPCAPGVGPRFVVLCVANLQTEDETPLELHRIPTTAIACSPHLHRTVTAPPAPPPPADRGPGAGGPFPGPPLPTQEVESSPPLRRPRSNQIQLGFSPPAAPKAS